MKSKLIHADSIDSLIKNIDKHIKEGYKPTLAFIYVSIIYDVRMLVTQLNRYRFEVFGATTVGEVSADKVHGVQENDDSIVCMLIDMKVNAFSFKFMGAEPSRSFEVGEDVGKWALNNFKDTAIITATSGLSFDNDAYTQGILSKGISDAFGGLAGDNWKFKDTYIFSKNNFSNNGIVAIAIDKSKINISGSRAFAWAGMGKDKIVTKSEKNIVYEIDNKPAIDFYRASLPFMNKNMPKMGIEYPLEVKMRHGEIVYRAVLAINEKDGSLMFAGHVEQKSRVRIATSAGKGIIEHVKRSIIEVRKERQFKPEIALVFSCCSHKQVLGDYTIEEIEATYEATQSPLIGFFTYGEIGAFAGGYGFHNETFVTALLSEKEV